MHEWSLVFKRMFGAVRWDGSVEWPRTQIEVKIETRYKGIPWQIKMSFTEMCWNMFTTSRAAWLNLRRSLRHALFQRLQAKLKIMACSESPTFWTGWHGWSAFCYLGQVARLTSRTEVWLNCIELSKLPRADWQSSDEKLGRVNHRHLADSWWGATSSREGLKMEPERSEWQDLRIEENTCNHMYHSCSQATLNVDWW